MPSNKFYLDDQKTQELVISWKGWWKEITVTHNGHVIGGFQNLDHLKQGNVFHLQDGSTIGIHYSTERYAQGMRVDYNGRPLKGTGGDPDTRLKGIFGIAIFIGALNFIIGAIAEFGNSEFLLEMGASWILMVLGAIIVGLGFCVWKYRSTAALITIILLLVADILLTLYFSLEDGGRPGFGGTVLKVFMIIAMAKGFSAIRDIKDAEAIGDRNLQNRNPF